MLNKLIHTLLVLLVVSSATKMGDNRCEDLTVKFSGPADYPTWFAEIGAEAERLNLAQAYNNDLAGNAPGIAQAAANLQQRFRNLKATIVRSLQGEVKSWWNQQANIALLGPGGTVALIRDNWQNLTAPKLMYEI